MPDNTTVKELPVDRKLLRELVADAFNNTSNCYPQGDYLHTIYNWIFSYVQPFRVVYSKNKVKAITKATNGLEQAMKYFSIEDLSSHCTVYPEV